MQQHMSLSKKAEQRVKRQLVEALIFEGLIEYEESKCHPDSDSLFQLFGKERTYRCEGRRTAFDRVRIKADSIFQILPDNTLIEATIRELVEELLSNEDDKNRLLNELQQTIKLCEWNEHYLVQPANRSKSSYEELESELIEGHPYHPCFKSRTGFTIEDHKKYGPEAKQPFTLKWAAIRRSQARMAFIEEEESFWKRELGQDVWENLLGQLAIMEGTFEEYTFLPIHPWQLNSIINELTDCMKERDLLLLDSGGDPYRATQSVRTLWNVMNPEKAYMKFSMNMVNTSSLRKLAAHSVCSAPHISTWIQNVIQSDAYLQNEASLVVLKEYAGTIFEPKEEKIKSKLDGQLGVIWRESIRSYIKEEEEAVPFTALMMTEKEGRPFIDDWLSRYGRHKWLKRFIEVSVVPVWHLLVAHGIAVEAHAQNMILLHKDGWPTRVVLRDFHESVEYTEEYLADPNMVPPFAEIHERYKGASADQYYWMSSIEALRELIMDSLFVFHLSELSFLMEEQYGYKEENFWSLVETGILEHVLRFPALISRHQQLHHTSKQIYVESLLTKKLKNKEDGDFRHLVGNVLAKQDKAILKHMVNFAHR